MAIPTKALADKIKAWVMKTPGVGALGRWVRGFFDDTRQEVLKLPAPRRGVPGQPLSKQYEPHACPEYMDLKMHFRDIGRMNAIIETLGRDFLTAMPEGAYKSRLGQIGFLYRRMHEDLANEDIARLIEKAHNHQQRVPGEWDGWDRANLREMEVMYRHHCQVDPEMMERRARLAYEGRRKHRDVLRENDWASAREFLEDMIDLQRRIGDSKQLRGKIDGPDATYQAIMGEYMPGMDVKFIEDVFGRLEAKVKDMLPWILERQTKEGEPLSMTGPFLPKTQMWLNRSLLKVIGFDFDRGGLYETGHNPVEGGTPDDTRLVIKAANADNFLESMKSALHEGGHGLYIQGLPRKEWRYQPVGQDMGAAVQESQALLIEMVLGRTKEFFSYLAPRVEGLFQKFGDPAMSARNLYKLKTRVRPGLDRKSADEVTYFFHILHRFRLERDLISGKLKVKDLPDAWNASIKTLLDVTPKTHAEGCLQDVHWFVGKFGYFPAYTLGHMMAAQMHEALRRDIQNVPELMREGDFRPIGSWLLDKIHSRGRLMPMHELMEKSTGSPLSPGALIRHLEERYLEAA